uniref:Protein kinase domain-containing protein n=1 Tax=viral metagenome TaxID=1070528 RepID=A0A6C0BTQ2_9ZZZZ
MAITIKKQANSRKQSKSRKQGKSRRQAKSRKQANSRKRLRGGKVFGRGTYGIVLGEPRIPCDNEEFVRDRIESKQEVSKLFFNERDVKNIVTTLELLNKAFTKDELKELNKYFILPENLCKLNKKEMRTHASVYNDAWREGTDFSKHTMQTTSDQGKRDLGAELIGVSTKDGIIKFLKKTQRIIEGIEKIHDKNIIHGDLKLQNTMVDLQGNFKIIDVDELRDIEKLGLDGSFFYDNHSYVIWPTLANMFLINYYKTLYTSNDDFIRKTARIMFNIQSEKEFHTQYDNTLSLVVRPDFSETMLKEKNPTNYTTANDKILKILVKNHGKEPSEHLKAIYKFIDRYSFGIILLGVLKRYFEIVGAKADDSLVADLLEIIEECCFLKNGLKTTTHHIKTEYIKFVDSL